MYNEVEILSIEEVMEDTDVYDIQVEDDESFIAEGVVVHNCLRCSGLDGHVYLYRGRADHDGIILPQHPFCRCFYSPLTYSWRELARRHNVPFNNTQQDYFSGRAFDIITYNQWFSGLKTAEQLEILGPARYKLWSQGKLKLNQMATQNQIFTLRELESKAKRGLAAELKASDKIPAGVRSNMSTAQIKAIDNYVPSDKKSRTLAELTEREVAKNYGVVHIKGKRPFDMFFNNEFIEHKTLVSGKGQIKLHISSLKNKTDFSRKYKTRSHMIITDKRPGSVTYGKSFYGKDLKNYTLGVSKDLIEIKSEAHLKSLLEKGARKKKVLPPAKTKVKTNVSRAESESIAKKTFGVAEVDYDGISDKAAVTLNEYFGGAIERLGIKPKKIVVLETPVGESIRTAAVAFEDGSIYLQSKFFSTTDDIARIAKENFNIKHFATASRGQIVRHEMGHLKYFHLGGTEASATKKLTKSMMRDLNHGIGPLDLNKYVSKYALKSQGEFYAEMMAKSLNGEVLHPVVRKLMLQIEKSLGRNLSTKFVASHGRGLAAKITRAITPGEKVIKKQLNQLRYNLKVGKAAPKPGSKVYDVWWSHSHKDRLQLASAWEKAGIKVPKSLLLPKAPVKPVIVAIAKPVKKIKPVVKKPAVKKPTKKPPKKTTPAPAPTPAPTPTEGAGWLLKDLDKSWKSGLNNLNYNIKVGKTMKPSSKPIALWDKLAPSEKKKLITKWKSKGYDVPDIFTGSVKYSPTKDVSISFPKPKLVTKPKAIKDTGETVINKITTTGFHDAKVAEVVVDDVVKELNKMYEKFPGLKDYLKGSLGVTKKELKGLRLINDIKVDVKGAAGNYDKSKRVIDIAAAQPRRHQLSIGSGNFVTGTDLHSTIRHELGHHFCDDLIGTANYKKWKALWTEKGGSKYFKKRVSTYSGTEQYEAFAESFAAYTSPRYGVGNIRLPKEIEEYFDFLLKNKKAVPKKTLAAEMIAPENQVIYEQHLARYTKVADNMDIQMFQGYVKDQIESKADRTLSTLQRWQGSTQSGDPMGLKYKAELLENRDLATFSSISSRSSYTTTELLKFSEAIPDSEYLRIKALTQAYYEKKGIKTVKLYRGTDGQNSGPEFRRRINELKEKYPDTWQTMFIEVEESSLMGWTSAKSVADQFGYGAGGITQTAKIKVKDIFIPHDIWPKRAYLAEKEFIVYGKASNKVSLKNITAKPKVGSSISSTTSTPTGIINSIKDVENSVVDYLKKTVDFDASYNPAPMMLEEDVVKQFKKKLDGIKKAVDSGQQVKIEGKVVGQTYKKIVIDKFEDAIEEIEKHGYLDYLPIVID